MPATSRTDPTATAAGEAGETDGDGERDRAGGSGESGALIECAQDQDGLATTVPYRDLAGIEPDLLSVDVHAPADPCGAPVVLWVHGGGFQVGDKSRQLADKIRLFNDEGWLLVSANYRLTDPDDPSSARFPDHYEDIAAAVGWVYDEIERYGGDPDRIALLGHSAGADIVANVSTNPTYLAGEDLALSDIACAGPLDTAGFDKTALGADGDESDLWGAALGNEPEYRTKTSATLVARAGIGIPPTIGVSRGRSERRRIEEGYLETLESLGVQTTLIDARSLSHAEVNSRIGAPGDDVMTAPLVGFLRDCLG